MVSTSLYGVKTTFFCFTVIHSGILAIYGIRLCAAGLVSITKTLTVIITEPEYSPIVSKTERRHPCRISIAGHHYPPTVIITALSHPSTVSITRFGYPSYGIHYRS